MMTPGPRFLNLVGWTALIAVMFWIAPAAVFAAPTAHTKPKASGKARSKGKFSTKHASAKRRGSHSTRYRYRVAQLRMDPGRIEEIQGALIREGYLAGPANGKWDDKTRSAMRRYQADKGFPGTGLPEAKSLMKLGLGSHPLPAEVSPGAQARASVDSMSKPGASSDPSNSTTPPPNPRDN